MQIKIKFKVIRYNINNILDYIFLFKMVKVYFRHFYGFSKQRINI